MSQNIRQKGQALLLVLLAMAAIMTVVLSVASRSVSDVSISTSEEDALRAFSAAEAGIEKSLLTGLGSSGRPDGSDTSVAYASVVTRQSEGNAFVYPTELRSGESATFWLTERTPTGGFTCSGGTCFSGPKIKDICWGRYPAASYGSGEKPAVMISVYYDWNGTTTGNLINSGGTDFTNVKVVRRGFDPDNSRSELNNFFSDKGGGCRIGSTNFAYHTGNINFLPSQSNNSDEINIPNGCRERCLIMIKVRVLYNNIAKPEQVGMEMTGSGGESLPAQGNRIESTGVAGSSSRKVNVFQTYSEPPSIFDAAVFSLSDFSK